MRGWIGRLGGDHSWLCDIRLIRDCGPLLPYSHSLLGFIRGVSGGVGSRGVWLIQGQSYTSCG